MAITAQQIQALTEQINAGYLATYEGRTAHDRASLAMLVKASGGEEGAADDVNEGDHSTNAVDTLPHLSVLLPNTTVASPFVATELVALRRMAVAAKIEGADDMDKDALVAALEQHKQITPQGDGFTLTPPVLPVVRDAVTGEVVQSDKAEPVIKTERTDDPPADASTSPNAALPLPALRAKADDLKIDGAATMSKKDLLPLVDAAEQAKASAPA